MKLEKSSSFIHDWSTKYFVKPETDRFLGDCFSAKISVVMTDVISEEIYKLYGKIYSDNLIVIKFERFMFIHAINYR